jgi:hypothetical protein
MVCYTYITLSAIFFAAFATRKTLFKSPHESPIPYYGRIAVPIILLFEGFTEVYFLNGSLLGIAWFLFLFNILGGFKTGFENDLWDVSLFLSSKAGCGHAVAFDHNTTVDQTEPEENRENSENTEPMEVLDLNKPEYEVD